MITESEGIVLKQVKTVGGRRMILLLSKRFGKISAGTSIDEKGKNRAALALRPFTYGKYELNKTGDAFFLNFAETIASHYRIGEDIDKFMTASYVMEFTEKLAPEDMPCPELVTLLVEFLDMIERRNKNFGTLVIAYILKALRISGNAPQLDSCVFCGSTEGLSAFHVSEGGVFCSECGKLPQTNERLIYDVEFDIVKILRYLAENPLHMLEHLALDDKTLEKLWRIMKSYLAYHLDISSLKSEEFL